MTSQTYLLFFEKTIVIYTQEVCLPKWCIVLGFSSKCFVLAAAVFCTWLKGFGADSGGDLARAVGEVREAVRSLDNKMTELTQKAEERHQGLVRILDEKFGELKGEMNLLTQMVLGMRQVPMVAHPQAPVADAHPAPITGAQPVPGAEPGQTAQPQAAVPVAKTGRYHQLFRVARVAIAALFVVAFLFWDKIRTSRVIPNILPESCDVPTSQQSFYSTIACRAMDGLKAIRNQRFFNFLLRGITPTNTTMPNHE